MLPFPVRMPDAVSAMDAQNIALIQRSFEKVRAPQAQIAEIFYAELFAIDPALRSMFSADMQAQYRKFLSALHYLMYALHAPEKIVGSVEKLAQAHVQYGVTPEHYTAFGIALLRALKKVLGAEFTPELCDAWAETYQMLARAMNVAAYGPAPEKIMQVAWWRSLLFDDSREGALVSA